MGTSGCTDRSLPGVGDSRCERRPEGCIPPGALSARAHVSFIERPIHFHVPLQTLIPTHSETAASENATSYFPLLDRVASGYFATASNEQELYTAFLEVLR